MSAGPRASAEAITSIGVACGGAVDVTSSSRGSTPWSPANRGLASPADEPSRTAPEGWCSCSRARARSGSAWAGSCSDRQPAFREAIELCDRAVRSETGWSRDRSAAALTSRRRGCARST